MNSKIIIAGVDEVGRGPLAGPVIAAAVIFYPEQIISGLKDSKLLTPAKRDVLYEIIISEVKCYAFGRAEAAEIDQINILQASLLAMKRAVAKLACTPSHILVDGNMCPKWQYSAEAIVKGDQKIPQISAASILAKVSRDREMQLIAKKYPSYSFDEHKGYPTKKHLAALQKYGPCKHHRKSFAPVRKVASNKITNYL